MADEIRTRHGRTADADGRGEAGAAGEATGPGTTGREAADREIGGRDAAAEGGAEIAPFDRRILLVAAAVLALLMALSTRYGFHIDELYFLDSARHLQAGYVDQPVLAPLLARLSLSLFGVSEAGLRLWPALAAAGTVVVGGLTARELGGARRVQLLAAVATGTMPVLLGGAHIANTTSYEMLAWAAIALVVVRIGRTGDTRWWLAAGALVGVGAEFNHLAAAFGVVLVACVLLGPARRTVVDRRLLAGAVLAVLLVLPDLWWQERHGWAMFAMTRALNAENGGPANILTFVFGQFGMSCLAMAVLWLAGLRFLWRSGRPLWRCLVTAYGVLFVLFAVTTGAQVYYLGGLYVCLLAAGAVDLDEWLHSGRRRLAGLLTGTAVSAALLGVIVLPVLPPSAVAWTYGISTNSGETLGWPQLVATVGKVWAALPPAQRAHAVVFTADYGEAGAIDELGRGTGLPTAVSSHNTDWWWGPGNPRATTVVAIAPGPDSAPGYAARLSRYFRHVRVAAALSNPYGVHNTEWGGHVYVCTGPRRPWGAVWPELRTYQ
ncbi:ArnT family glycosyltransferase [Streptomyces fuscigenes]|uniref:ArnT family glycosyltransferase n=1 Tax=Streptomyces fuscigenes TaxID=1528880 RepID=UPI001F2CDFEA|nr:glycosyltransferase family 39 protein [Streptomyces fuscigenes]MCF3962753.1 glycosyltransferase family 39 protein [Streptomyces fuscigenes]